MSPHRAVRPLAAVLLIGACGGEPAPPASIEQLIAALERRVESVTLAEEEGGVVPRFNQPRTIGCVNADFRVHEDVPDALRHGLFAQSGSHPAWLRFANATRPDDSEKDIRGLSIRVSDVEGEVLSGEPGLQDFLLNSYPALFVATPEDFLAFARARDGGSLLRFFADPFDPHLASLLIALRARAHHLSPLDIRYWSTVPFALGPAGQSAPEEGAVKYSVTPCSDYRTEEAVEPGEHQLRAALAAHLSQEPACLAFGVQTRTDAEAMPIEDASAIWDEQASPFVTVATITIEKQPVGDADTLERCERDAFNPWQSLPEHLPLGRMNAVRGAVYEHGAAVRERSGNP